MAQEVEHVLGKDEVTGSNPVSSSSVGTRRFLKAFAEWRRPYCNVGSSFSHKSFALQNLCGSPVSARRILKQLERTQAVFFNACISRAVVPALGQETARTMRCFLARKRSKPRRGFDEKALSRPLPKKSLLHKSFWGAL